MISIIDDIARTDESTYVNNSGSRKADSHLIYSFSLVSIRFFYLDIISYMARKTVGGHRIYTNISRNCLECHTAVSNLIVSCHLLRFYNDT